jgi:hypothetical protein
MAGASAAAAGAAVLSLIGCSSNGSRSAGDSSQLIGNEKDTTKEAKPGVYLDSYASEIANMDPLFIVGNIISHLTPVYG